MSTHYFTIKPLQYDVFVGMDVDKTSISITVVSHEGELLQRKLPYDAANLLALIAKRFPTKKIAFCYEAGPTGYGLYDQIASAGFNCIVVPPATVPKAPSERVKTNRLDSRKLAESLRGGNLHGIHVPTAPYRSLRHLVQLRETLLHQVVSYKNRIKGFLLMEGIPFPPATRRCQWTQKVLEQLKTMPLPITSRFKLDSLLYQLQSSKIQLNQIATGIQKYCSEEPELSESIQLLMSLPGIAWIVAMHLLARIGDWRYLQNPHQIAGLLGLIPVEDSTGLVINRGSITRMGDSAARNKLIETAWTAIRYDQQLREFFLRVCLRHPRQFAKRKAIVAVARKLTIRIYVVLKFRRPYLPYSQFLALQEQTRR